MNKGSHVLIDKIYCSTQFKGLKAWHKSNACSENMIDWQYLSLGWLEQDEFFSQR